MNPLLKVNSLKIVFTGSSKLAVDDLSFELFPSETLGIVGESGSGKSATVMALLQLLPVGTIVEGKALFFDPNNQSVPVDLLSIPGSYLNQYRGRKISIIFQDPMASLNPSMRCGIQVEEMLKLHTNLTAADRKSRVLRLFEEVQLPQPDQMYYRYPFQLSGGQRQRVMIAMALATRPHILIADEPTTALDVTTQHEILNLLQNLQKQYSLSIIFISHDLCLVERIANRLLVLRNGKLVEQGKNPDLFLRPEKEYTRHLLACRLSLKGKQKVSSTIDSDTETILPHTLLVPAANSIRYQADPLLVIRNLEVHLPTHQSLIGKHKKQILHRINLQLWEGETLGIVGESGSGKTTLGRTLMQLVRSYSGEILYRGVAVNQLVAADKKQFYQSIQLIFQDPYASLNPRMRIGELIREPLQVHGLVKTKEEQIKRVCELLEAVQIDPAWYHRYPHQLSGGQRQRIAIARALALQPRILICDECVSALDTTIAAQILNLLNELKKKYGLSYLFISHDLGIVRFMADRVIVLKDGMIVEENYTEQLFERPGHPYTQKLLEASL
ncbi:MAG: dipeptide ABC transporter ATP-binding protein [Bacteroidales bacterium]